MNGLAVDPAGDIVVTGAFQATVDLGGGAITSTGGNDVFLAKYSGVNGAHIWSLQFGGPDRDWGLRVAIDRSGDALVTGMYQGPVDLGGPAPLPAHGMLDVFLAKFHGTDGSYLWSRGFGNGVDDIAGDVAVDPNGDVAFGANFQGPVDLGGGMIPFIGGFNIGVGKYVGASGAHLWSAIYGGSGVDFTEGTAVGEGGTVIFGGDFENSASFGGAPLTSAGMSDLFVASFDGSNGSGVWSARVGGPGAEASQDVTVDPNGDIVVVGVFTGTTDLGGGAIASLGDLDAFVAKYSGVDGTYLWSKRLGGPGRDQAPAVAVDANCDVVVAGSFTGTADFDGQTLVSAGGTDLFLARLAP